MSSPGDPPARVRLKVRIKPNARREAIEPAAANERIRVSVTAPPVDGKANRALVALLATAFDVPKSRIVIVSGLAARDKTVEIRAPGRMPESLRRIHRR